MSVSLGQAIPRLPPVSTSTRRSVSLSLFALANPREQTKQTPISLSLSPTGLNFSIISLPSLALTTFSFPTGRIQRKYDESLSTISEMHQAGTLLSTTVAVDPATGEAGRTVIVNGGLDSMEFGRRLAVERELEKAALEGVLSGHVVGGLGVGVGVGKAVWDDGGKFVIYPTLVGIKGRLLPLVLDSEY